MPQITPQIFNSQVIAMRFDSIRIEYTSALSRIQIIGRNELGEDIVMLFDGTTNSDYTFIIPTHVELQVST